MLSWVADRFLRIDTRSLGVFRFAMGLTLLGDLFHRWDWLRAFYSNDGVLPNHNHLFLLKDKAKAWSALHAFSSPDENHFAFLIILFIYVCFTLGWHTRVFHVLSVVCLVSLTARNLLLESVGNSVAIALLGMSALLPLGLSFSVDSLRRSMAAVVEHNPDELNERTEPPAEMPASLTALLLVVMLGCICLFTALQQDGATWKDGTALYYALHVDRWTGNLGLAIRESSGALGALTKLVRIAGLGVLPLALVPVARRFVRPAAMALLAIVGLTFGLLFTFGLYGWTLLSACALLIGSETWDALGPNRKITLIFDDDCGICLWVARLVKRFDLRQNVTFAGSSDHDELPKGVTVEMTDSSIVVVGRDGAIHTDALAVSELLRSLPLLWVVGLLIRVPGLLHLTRWLYSLVAERRIDISIACGMAACGVPDEDEDEASHEPRSAPTPASVAWRRLRMLTGNALAVLLFGAFLAQSEANNPIPAMGLANRPLLIDIATWSRMMAPWDVLAPDPPKENGRLVVDAETKGGWVIDLISGHPPDLELNDPRGARRSVLWAAYTDRIRKKEYDAYRQEFRRYLTRGGFAVDTSEPANYISRFTAAWLSVDTPAPGQPRSGEIRREDLLGHGAAPRPAPRPGLPSGGPNLRRFPKTPIRP